jgi:hypothetical protein
METWVAWVVIVSNRADGREKEVEREEGRTDGARRPMKILFCRSMRGTEEVDDGLDPNPGMPTRLHSPYRDNWVSRGVLYCNRTNGASPLDFAPSLGSDVKICRGIMRLTPTAVPRLMLRGPCH